jgi:aspartate/methionine/tyrosine aminotransferase
MTGWRLGYAIVPPPLVPIFSRLMINTVSCTSTFSQMAAVEALTGPQDAVDAMVEEFRARRSLVVDGLDDLPGVSCRMPQGAFYAFPDVHATGFDGQGLAERLLLDAGVSVLAGTAFGGVATGHLRVSYANSRENISRALDRMRQLLTTATAA